MGKIPKKKGGIKLHTVLDLGSNIPTIIDITTAKVHDVNFLDNLVVELGALYIFDRGYVDYKRLYKINLSNAFFIVRAKKNLSFKVLKSNKIDKSKELRCDQIIRLKIKKSYEDYPANFRRIKVYDEDKKKYIVLLTNNLEISTSAVALLYKKRWQIELFFKWIKQHLKIKVFWGQNENAVRTQIWIAVCNYALIYLIKNEQNLLQSPYEILEILKDSLFEQTPVNQLLMSDF